MADWSPLEEWIQEQARAEKVANLDDYPGAAPRTFLPVRFARDRDGWRIVSARFLRWFLLSDKSPVRGGEAGIIGAWVFEDVDLAGHEITPFGLQRCRFDRGLNIENSSCPRLSLAGSVVNGELRLQRATIRQVLDLSDDARFERIAGAGLRVGFLYLNGSCVTGEVDINSSDIAGSADLSVQYCDRIVARGIKVDTSIYRVRGGMRSWDGPLDGCCGSSAGRWALPASRRGDQASAC